MVESYGIDHTAFQCRRSQCIAVKDGTFSYPTGWFFSNVSQEQLEGSLRDHDLPLNQVVSPYISRSKHTANGDSQTHVISQNRSGPQ
jgi:hypothetical protein